MLTNAPIFKPRSCGVDRSYLWNPNHHENETVQLADVECGGVYVSRKSPWSRSGVQGASMEVGWRADMVASCSVRGVVTFPGGMDYAFTRASATQTWDTKRDVKRINLHIYLVINSLRI